LIGYVMGNRLTGPIIKLTQKAHAFASGNFDQRVDLQSADEIGDLAVTFNTMAGQIQGLISSLELRVIHRTNEAVEQQKIAARRSSQFESITRVAKTISTARNLFETLPRIAEVISEQFDYYHVGIFLNDPSNHYAVLSAANSEGGRRMLSRGHQLRIGEQGIVGYATGTGMARISLDVGEDAVFFNNPELPLTRSELALPLISNNKVIGALDIQSTEANAFSDEDINVLTALADHVSLAIENSKLFDQTQTALKHAQAISARVLRKSWDQVSTEHRIFGYKYSISGVAPLGDQDGQVDAAVRQEILVPIHLRGEKIGNLRVHIPKDDRIGQDQLDLIKAVAERVALSAENARLFDETQRRAERERVITEITSKIGASVRTENILKTTAREINQLLDGADVLIKLKADARENG
jgi:GAF domain-containing protein/HAMP domain-containing protein